MADCLDLHAPTKVTHDARRSQCDGAIDVVPTPGAPVTVSYAFGDLERTTPADASCNPNEERLDLWYRFTATADGPLMIATDSFRHFLALYDMCGGTELACADNRDDGGTFIAPVLEYEMKAGESVVIRIGAWDSTSGVLHSGSTTFSVEGSCAADLDASGAIDFTDLLVVLSSWGDCLSCPADLDSSGTVDFTDLLTLLAAWGACP